jgi:hypothetical protein
MSSPPTPVVAENAASAGPPPLPTMTRVVAVLVIALAGIGLLSTLSQIARLSHVPTPVFGIIVRPPVGIAFTITLEASNLILAILILRRFAWVVDVLIAIQAFGLLNNVAYLLSPVRRVYVATVLAQTQARMPAPATPGFDPNLFSKIMSVAVSVGIAVSILIAVVFITLLLVDRRRYRRVCLSGQA